MMPLAARSRPCHWRRADALMTWCGRHTQKVVATGRRQAVTCARCRSLAKQAERGSREERP